MSDLKVRPPNDARWAFEAQDKRDEPAAAGRLAATGFNGEDGALKGRRYVPAERGWPFEAQDKRGEPAAAGSLAATRIISAGRTCCAFLGYRSRRGRVGN